MTDEPTPEEAFAAHIAALLRDEDEPPPDVVPRTDGRPSLEVARRLLAMNGRTVTVADTQVMTDPDGVPIGTATTETGATLTCSGAALGWPELDDDDDDLPPAA